MDVEEEEEELQGLEWEAEKAYIVATSPRSLACGSPSRDDKPEDDFSWEEHSSATTNKATIPRIVVSSDAEPSPSLEDGEKVAKSSENLKNVLIEKAPLPFILEDDNEASVETANNGEYQPIRGATNGATSNMITNGKREREEGKGGGEEGERGRETQSVGEREKCNPLCVFIR